MTYDMKSKCAYEWPRDCTGRNDFGVDRQLRVRAIDRNQNHREPSRINAFRGYILIQK